MFHDSQGIQHQGWLIQVTEENAIKPSKHGKSASGTMGKNRSRKHRSTCQNCGTEFNGRPRAANRFCQNSCQHEWAVNRWLSCSICMAKIGIGSKTAGRLLGISPPSVSRGWKNRGIIANRPKSGSIIHDGRAIITKQNQREQRVWRQYETAWMDEITCHKAFPDWSIMWRKERSRRLMKSRYHSMEREEKKEWNRLSSSRNPERRKKYLRQWKSHKRANDPVYRMIESFRARLSNIAKGKELRTKDLIGCDADQFKIHIQLRFKRGMTWANYGKHWHVDHILPISSFDHTDPKQVAQCWHWTNLRPLDAKRNMEKGATIEEPQMNLMLCATH